MKVPPIGWTWPTVASAGVLLSVVGYRIGLLLLLGAAMAVFGGVVTCARVLGWDARRSKADDPGVPPDPAGVRGCFVTGRAGREELLTRLEGLQPAGRDDPAARSAESRRRLLTAPETEFVRYLGWRIARIESSG
jgi:hypothetical protein